MPTTSTSVNRRGKRLAIRSGAEVLRRLNFIVMPVPLAMPATPLNKRARHGGGDLLKPSCLPREGEPIRRRVDIRYRPLGSRGPSGQDLAAGFYPVGAARVLTRRALAGRATVLLSRTAWTICSSPAAHGATTEPRVITMLTSISTACGASVVRSNCSKGSLDSKMTTEGPRARADLTLSLIHISEPTRQ